MKISDVQQSTPPQNADTYRKDYFGSALGVHADKIDSGRSKVLRCNSDVEWNLYRMLEPN